LKELNLDEHELVLLDNITHVFLKYVTITGGLSVQHCTQLRQLKLQRVDLGEHELVLPDSITCIILNKVTVTGRLSVQHCSKLRSLKLQSMTFVDDFPQLPTSITNIILERVTMSVRNLLALLKHLENLSHAVSCKQKKCKVKPSSEHRHVKNRLDTSINL